MHDSELVKKLAGRSIILVGIMGSGKSSVGRRLASHLGLEFVDADVEIEAAAGMSIAEIFAQHGEPYFRDGERRVINRLLNQRQLVLATGGGAFMNEQTRAAIARAGISVWLKADHDVLMRRVRKRATRPLLQSPNPDLVMRQLMDERYPVYATADITVMSDDGPHDTVIEAVLNDLEHSLNSEPKADSATISSVHVDIADRAYDVMIGRGLIADTGRYISKLAPTAGCAIVTDENVARHHLQTLTQSLDHHNIRHETIVLKPGETTKSIEMFSRVCDFVLERKFERNDLLIALGGGVIGDLTGYAAASLRRGMRFIQIPTSLLAQVDSSVGGKTAINSVHGKNLIGAFYQPSLVLADIGTLDSLPDREFRSGYAEIIKYGLINDAPFFHWLEKNVDQIFNRGPELNEAIRASCQSKANIVARDETEQAERALLNLGHTFAHALEVLLHYNSAVLVHGEAVAIGLACAARFSTKLGYMSGQDTSRIVAHIRDSGLKTKITEIDGASEISAGDILAAMYQDKKVNKGALTFILMRGIGQSFIARGIDEAQVLDFLNDELKVD